MSEDFRPAPLIWVPDETRYRALQLAVESYRLSATTEGILKRADVFFSYLKGEMRDVDVSSQA